MADTVNIVVVVLLPIVRQSTAAPRVLIAMARCAPMLLGAADLMQTGCTIIILLLCGVLVVMKA